MLTTAEWWERVSNNPEEMQGWLKKQYHGEKTAEIRVRKLITTFNLKGKTAKLINKIADDEATHAGWIADLLRSRGLEPALLTKDERYWSSVTPTEPYSFSYACAVGHHAEVMRLDRIRLLASDSRFVDIAEVFANILSDEIFHAAAFGSLASKEDIAHAKNKHLLGKQLLGLVP